jgi:glucose-1-phosphate adenylyltransferase
MVGEDRVCAFPFELGNRNPTPYWRDVGTVDAYWEAHMDLVAVTPKFNLYDREWPIHTYHEPWPPAKTVHEEPGRTGTAVSSLLSPGCIVSGSLVVRSVLSPGVRVNSFAHVEDSVLLSGVDVGRGARVRRAVVDKGVRIPPGETIGYDLDLDRRRFTVSERGIVVVPKEARF